MKRGWFITIIIINTLTAHTQVIQNATIFNIEAFARCCCRELQIENCLIMIKDESLIRFGIQGQTSEIDSGNSYYILIDRGLNYDKSLLVVAHELVHVKQMQSGMLKFSHDSIYFRLKSYPNKSRSHSFHDHEIEAVVTSKLLFEKYSKVRVYVN